MVHVLLSIPKPVGKAGETLQLDAEMTSFILVVKNLYDVSTHVGVVA